MTALGNTVRVAVLSWREKFWLWNAGRVGLAWQLCADRLTRKVLGRASAKVPARSSRKGASEARRALITTELGEIDQRKREVETELKAGKQKPADKSAKLAAVPTATPPRARAVVWAIVALALLLLLGDALFIFIAVADHFGLDITGSSVDAAPILLVGIGAGTLVAVLLNAWFGSKSTVKDPPSTRLWGRVGLAFMAIAVAGLRVGASPDDSIWFVMLGFMVTLAGGLAAGGAHHVLADEFRRRAEARSQAIAVTGRRAEADAATAKLEAELRSIEARRRSLTVELDELANEPEERLAEDQELERLKEARLAEGRYFYNLGAHYAGRKGTAEEESGNA